MIDEYISHLARNIWLASFGLQQTIYFDWQVCEPRNICALFGRQQHHQLIKDYSFILPYDTDWQSAREQARKEISAFQCQWRLGMTAMANQMPSSGEADDLIQACLPQPSYSSGDWCRADALGSSLSRLHNAADPLAHILLQLEENCLLTSTHVQQKLSVGLT